MSLLYFAYGSNLLPERLTTRCPSAVPHSSGIAANYDLDFSKVSSDNSGKATLFARKGKTTSGYIYALDENDLPNLDRHEGLGKGYRRDDNFLVAMAGSEESISTVCYLATWRDPHTVPYDWYLALVVAGAIHHGFEAAAIKKLQSTHYKPDPQEGRIGRRQAIEVFARRGVTDYREYLNSEFLSGSA